MLQSITSKKRNYFPFSAACTLMLQGSYRSSSTMYWAVNGRAVQLLHPNNASDGAVASNSLTDQRQLFGVFLARQGSQTGVQTPTKSQVESAWEYLCAKK
jgi:hypothetical protein